MVPIKHIVFVDDDPDDHHIFSTTLQEVRSDIQLSSFHDCQQLLQFLNGPGQLPDIIFLDLNMPTFDGRDCLQLLKKEAHLLHIPVIIYSTSQHKKDIDLCYAYGATKYVVKPTSFEKLKEILKSIFSSFES
jgi:CheY-like chemotaxis protein